MSTSLLMQYVVVAVAVLASAVYVVHRQWPAMVRRVRVAMAVILVRPKRARWVQRLGRWLAPAPNAVGGSACGGCEQECETKPPKSH